MKPTHLYIRVLFMGLCYGVRAANEDFADYYDEKLIRTNPNPKQGKATPVLTKELDDYYNDISHKPAKQPCKSQCRTCGNKCGCGKGCVQAMQPPSTVWRPPAPTKISPKPAKPLPPKPRDDMEVDVVFSNHPPYPPKPQIKHYVLGKPWQKVSWVQAKRNCKKIDQELATIINQKEQRKFEQFLQKEGVVTDNVWIGLTDKDEEGNFKWVDNKPLSYWGYSNWLPGEPSNTNNAEHCVQSVVNIDKWFRKKGLWYQWDDAPCDVPAQYKYYICQYKVDKTYKKKV